MVQASKARQNCLSKPLKETCATEPPVQKLVEVWEKDGNDSAPVQMILRHQNGKAILEIRSLFHDQCFKHRGKSLHVPDLNKGYISTHMQDDSELCVSLTCHEQLCWNPHGTVLRTSSVCLHGTSSAYHIVYTSNTILRTVYMTVKASCSRMCVVVSLCVCVLQ